MNSETGLLAGIKVVEFTHMVMGPAAGLVLADLGAPRRACVVISERNDNLYKSFRNFPRVTVRTAAELCAYDIVNGGTIIAEQGALDQLKERVGAKGGDQ